MRMPARRQTRRQLGELDCLVKAAGVAYLLGLIGVAIDGRVLSALLFAGTTLVAAAVRHRMGGGRCRNRGEGTHANGYSAGSR